MNITTRKYKLVGLNRILGAQAANPKVRSEFIASKARELAKGEEETGMLPEENLDTKGLTVFLRDDGVLCLSDYVIKGFLKDAIKSLRDELNIGASDSKVDNYVLVTPSYLRFTKAGKPVTAADDIYERPLRAMTMQGPRVSVTASEIIDKGWQLEFEISLLSNRATPKSKALTFEAIEEALNYGAFKGLGQWRNGQNGRFIWARVLDV
ncbi:MAG: hypothetical protein IJ418_12055 [Clostridia bacterium]|nr:hypothetical protein [Clostridia bacterium]